MKVATDWGTQPETDVARVRAVRRAIGDDAELFVDANGGYSAREAIAQAERFTAQGVSYFEEPVSSDHLDQLAFVRHNVSMSVAAGEYGYDSWYFRDMLQAGAVDVLQADATPCLGVTGFLEAAVLAHSYAVPFSAHTGPTIHAHAGCVDFEVLDSGCCGLAGGFGFEAGGHYDVSMKAGERVLLPAVRAAANDTLVVADGFSCREQIAHASNRRALHLADLLQIATHESAVH